MRIGVALALTLILLGGITAGPFSTHADEEASTTPPADTSISDTGTTSPDASGPSFSALDVSPLAPNEHYIELPISYNEDWNTYYFSDIMPFCDTSLLPNGRPRQTEISWYIGTYPNQTAYPGGTTIFDCARDTTVFGIPGVLSLLDVYQYPLATYTGDESILIDNGTNRYILRYHVENGVITAPGSPTYVYTDPFRPRRDPIGEARVLPATVTGNILAVDPSVCSLLLSSVGGLRTVTDPFDPRSKDHNIWGGMLRPEHAVLFGPDHWPTADATDAGLLYQMRTDYDPGTGNPACENATTTNPFAANHLDLDYFLFDRREVPREGGPTNLFFWYSTKTQPGYSYDSTYSNTTPLGYIPLVRANGVWSIATSSPATTTPSTVDNVLFLPGIEGSRLYDGDGTKLWEPEGFLIQDRDNRVKKLFLDESGKSIDADIHTKEGDVLSQPDIYGSFIDTLNNWKTEGTIADWKAISYDWRLTFDDLLNNGAEVNGNISYLTATDTPYIIQTLRKLAADAPSKKVTIIAHSNGGLLAKALMIKLGTEAPDLVDKIILVAVPQSGAPEAIGDVLFGQDIMYNLFGPVSISIASKPVTREFALNSPMAYHLLPSQAYFDSVHDPAHSVAEFTDQSLYQKERNAYGFLVDTWQELSDYILAKDGGRTQPASSDITNPAVGNSTLVSYAQSEHDVLDSWTPPAGVNVYQVAGWGIEDTVAGTQFYDQPVLGGLLGFKPMYRPLLVEDGDGVVPVPSALLMNTSTDNVQRYWVDLNDSNIQNHERRSHSSILGLSQLKDFIDDIFTNNLALLPNFINPEQPNTIEPSKKLIFFLHSPLTLGLYDENGTHTGLNEDGSVDQNIPGTSYGEFGEVKYIIAPAGGPYTLKLKGQGSGTFSLDIQEETGDTVTQTTTFADVPTTPQTTASLTISSGANDASPLTVDENGDDNTDITLRPNAGETVLYEPPPPPVGESKSPSGRDSRNVVLVSTSTEEIGTSPVGTLGEVRGASIYSPAYNQPASDTHINPPTGKEETSVQGGSSQQGWFSLLLNILYSRWSELLDHVTRFLARLLNL